jgi:hypothetical protein
MGGSEVRGSGMGGSEVKPRVFIFPESAGIIVNNHLDDSDDND